MKRNEGAIALVGGPPDGTPPGAFHPKLWVVIAGGLLGNGLAVNLKYTPDKNHQDKMLGDFVGSVKGYFDAAHGGTGGMEIQFNVTSHADFLDAVKNPQKHDQLLVRVSGYTAYFKDLNPQMQQEIIDRTEYDLATGRAVQFSRTD